MAHAHSGGWVARHARPDLIVAGSVGRWVKVTAGGGPPPFKTQTNTQTVPGDTRTVAFLIFFFLPSSYIRLSLHSRPD